ncbi:MAG: M23 family metallopeptidase [Bacteroidota bacterium]|jgi:murein DD-endopeptidase MepM/ murein hydrolase activator NlpD
MSNNSKKNFFSSFKVQHRLVLLNDELFEEKFSVRITPIKLATAFLGLLIFFIVISIFLVGATPLREYIPGYGDVSVKDSLIGIQSKLNDINEEIEKKDAYLKNLLNVIQGKNTPLAESLKRDSTVDYSKIKLTPGPNDSALRLQMELRDRYKLYLKDKSTPVNNSTSFFFFTPVKGMVTNSFNLAQGHYGVDIAGKENEIIKATMDGTVVSAGYSTSDGYVIQLQHSNNIISIYKHNSDLTKKVGDYVKAGEPVAIIGNTGESSNGMHLHFELWFNGNPLNPQDYVVF